MLEVRYTVPRKVIIVNEVKYFKVTVGHTVDFYKVYPNDGQWGSNLVIHTIGPREVVTITRSHNPDIYAFDHSDVVFITKEEFDAEMQKALAEINKVWDHNDPVPLGHFTETM